MQSFLRILKILAVIFWGGMAIVCIMLPYLPIHGAAPTGFMNAPNRDIIYITIFLAVLSIVPYRYLVNNKFIFFTCIGITSIPALWLLFQLPLKDLFKNPGFFSVFVLVADFSFVAFLFGLPLSITLAGFVLKPEKYRLSSKVKWSLSALASIVVLYFVFVCGSECYRSRTALAEIKAKAGSGDLEAQNKLGDMYNSGSGVFQNPTEAAKWYLKAAEKGHPNSQYHLGELYYAGRGLPVDYVAALKWYRRAADQGYAVAQSALGGMYQDGEGVPKDYSEAVKWRRKAAEQGRGWDQYKLAEMYYYAGHGVKQDYSEAVKWYLKAAEQDDHNSILKLAGMYEKGLGVPQDYVEAYKWLSTRDHNDMVEAKERLATHMTPEQLAEAKQRITAFRSQKK